MTQLTRIEIEISDPWEFSSSHGTGPFQGRLMSFFESEAYGMDKLGVAKFDTLLDCQGGRCDHLLLQSRYVDFPIVEVENGNNVICNLSAISEASAQGTDPMSASQNDPSSVVLIGTVTYRKKV
jgi:hypothetical protein